MSKIKTLLELARISRKVRKEGKTVGLITGCFDILHYGHIDLFRFAKRRVDVLIVGIDNDKTIKLSKGETKPMFPEEIRADTLAELESIDYVFIIKGVFSFDSHEADVIQEKVLKELKPSHLFTYVKADKYWQKKEKRVKKLGIIFIGQKKKKRFVSTSLIIQKLESEL